jgi:hypothetical protein
MAFQIPYTYDFITKLSRKQADVIQNHKNGNVHDIGKGEERHRKYKGSNLAKIKRPVLGSRYNMSYMI